MRNRERKRGGILQRISRHIEKLQCLRLGSRIGENINIYERVKKTRVQSLGQKDPLEEEMATHSTILAWRIPWTEMPGRLWSMSSHRVGHN